MKNIRVSALVSRRTLFSAFTLLVVILASDSRDGVLAQGSKDRTGSREWAIDRAQQAVRERITSREGGRDPTVLFNSDTKTEFKSNREVRVRGTGTFSRNNDWHNNPRKRQFTQPRQAVEELLLRSSNQQPQCVWHQLRLERRLVRRWQ